MRHKPYCIGWSRWKCSLKTALLGSALFIYIFLQLLIAPVFAGVDDYPDNLKNLWMDSTIDPWKEYNRECTSFVAWRLSSRNGFEMPFNNNGYAWGAEATARDYEVDLVPAVGAVAWWSRGHVAWVESVNNEAVTIEEYNADYRGAYSERTIPVSSVTGYIHFKDIVIAPPEPPPPPPPPKKDFNTQLAEFDFGKTASGPTIFSPIKPPFLKEFKN